MKIGANNLKLGNIIYHQGRSWRVLKLQHVKPGKGGAFLQIELKDIISGSKLNERFRSDDTVERMHLEGKACVYLYAQDQNYTFMDNETYEQYTLSKEFIGEEITHFLQNDMIVRVDFLDNVPIAITLPDKIVIRVKSTDATIKGQTASASYKPAILENGYRIMVPPHIDAGKKVVISTIDFSYIERAKE